MKAAIICGIVIIFMFMSIQAAMIGDKIKQNRCLIDIIEDCHGLCKRGKVDQSCTYIPSPGWAITSHETVITSKNNGWYRSTQIPSSGNKLISLHEAQQVFVTLIVSAGDIGNNASKIVGNLSLEYTKLRSQIPASGETAFQVKAHASAHGACWDRKRGWIEGHLDIEEIYLGQNYQDIINWIIFKNQDLVPAVQNLKCDATGCQLP